MQENPYKATGRSNAIRSFLRLPSTIIEWVVILLVVLVAIALLFAPNIEKGSKEARKLVEEKQRVRASPKSESD